MSNITARKHLALRSGTALKQDSATVQNIHFSTTLTLLIRDSPKSEK